MAFRRPISSSNSANPSSSTSLKKARNDSSNVSSLLAPGLERRSHRLIHCESCYCQDAPLPALLRLPFKKHRDEAGYKIAHHCSARSKEDKNSDSFVQCALLGGDDNEAEKVSVACQTENCRGAQGVAVDPETLAFRKDHYFECHSFENLAEESAPAAHKCVHKFTVNDRLLLEPINCDSFGVSRCEICDRPMEPPRKAEPPTEAAARKPGPPRVKKLYEHDLAPPRLNIASGGERIEIKVPESVSRECFRGMKSTRGVPLGNSFALRFQKRRE